MVNFWQKKPERLNETDDFFALYNKGLSLAKLKKHEDAIMYFDKALKIKSDNVDALRLAGFSFTILKKYEEAHFIYSNNWWNTKFMRNY